jgi:CrcB protein
MIPVLLVMTGGAIGSLGRYELGRLCAHFFGVGWPWGTLAANLFGGLVMGLLAGWLAMRGQAGEPIRLFLAVGVTGGFTTFSAFSLETMLMIQRGDLASALTYIAVSVVGALSALALGLFIMRGATA